MFHCGVECEECRMKLMTISELHEQLDAVKRARDELLDRIDVLNRQHDETRGYRQHAELQLAELKAAHEPICCRLEALLDGLE